MHSNFILNLYIAYEFNNWPRNPTNNFTLNFTLIVYLAQKLTRNVDKSKFTYNAPGIAFDGKVTGFLILRLLEMLQFLVLIIVHHLILIIQK